MPTPEESLEAIIERFTNSLEVMTNLRNTLQGLFEVLPENIDRLDGYIGATNSAIQQLNALLRTFRP